jgi:PAS domain S-box-containing protein
MNRDDRLINILLIEDNPGDVLLVEEYVSDVFEKAEIIQVSTFNKARKLLLDNHHFDVILLDLSLPDSDGMDLVDEILQVAESAPVIILTGYTNLEFSVESLAKGISDYLLKDELSAALLYKSIIYSIERSLVSERIRESEKNYRDLFELSPEPMMLFDLNTYEFLDVNRAVINRYGYSKQEFLSMTLMDIKPDSEKENAREIIQNTKASVNVTLDGEHRHVKKNGDIIFVEITASSLQYKGKPARIALAHDVTEKRKEEERLKLLESVITNSTESVMILEAKTEMNREGNKILYVNEAFTTISGFSFDEVIGKTPEFFNGPETDQNKVEEIVWAMNNWEASESELISYRKDGTAYWSSTSMVPVADGRGSYSHWVAITRDISDRIRYERKLRESLEEKETLLSEIHHRVKNNLAVVSSLMEMQAFGESNKDVERKLLDSTLRIKTMASIHEVLYESGSFSKLNFAEIIEKLLENIEVAMNIGKAISNRIRKESIDLNINQAVPCSMIINEVLTNIYKHAFPDQRKGEIAVDLYEKDNWLFLKISDNGIGLPDDFNPNEYNSLGILLIQTLVNQLHGEYTYKGSVKGTSFELKFEKSDNAGISSTGAV